MLWRHTFEGQIWNMCTSSHFNLACVVGVHFKFPPMFCINIRHALVICDRLRADQWWTFGWLICHYLRLFSSLSSIRLRHYYIMTVWRNTRDAHPTSLVCYTLPLKQNNDDNNGTIGIYAMHSVNLYVLWSEINSDWFCIRERYSNWRDFRKMIHLDFTIALKTPS